MNHLGDITKINGAVAPIVDCVIGGSPCQDLSIAGKRAGLAGERSGLYMEQIRIIKEMREHDRTNRRAGEFIRPRYMVWENVPGAFSSNNGKDFAAVLEEAVKIAEPEAPPVPVPKKGWPTSGCLMGAGWSVAWRVLDAQFWGVPQRRRRIALVADFGGLSAPEILFVRKSVSGYSEPGGTAGKGLAGSTESGTSFAVRIRGGCDGGGKGALVQKELSGTLGCNNDQTIFRLQGNGIDRADTAGCNGKGWKEDVCYTMNTIDRPAVCAGFSAHLGAKSHGIGYMAERSPTLSSQRHDASVLCLNDQGGSVMGVTENVSGTLRAQEHGHQPAVMCFEPGIAAREGGHIYENVCGTLRADPGDNRMSVAYSFDSLASNSMKSSNPNSGCRVVDIAKTLDTSVPDPSKNQGGVCVLENHPADSRVKIKKDGVCQSLTSRMGTGGGNVPMVADVGFFTSLCDAVPTLLARTYKDPHITITQKSVRRLTPLECERLQGFPDGWTDIGDWTDSKGKKRQTTDAARYKALGNSIALPPWKWVLKRLCAQYERDATMASLFDGIGGFPLIWERLNGKGSCLWASEIEEFPMAVTIKRFGGLANE